MNQLGIRLVAVLLSLGVLLASSLAIAQPSDQDIEAAKRHMKAGVAFMQDPDGAKYEEAYVEFKKAHELSGSLNALLNLAICAQNLELDGEAIEHYEEFLREKGDDIDPADKAQVETDLKRIKASVAWVTLSTDKVGVTIMDVRTPRQGFPIRNRYKGSIQEKVFGIHPGDHTFTAALKGQPDQVWKIRLENGSNHTHVFRFEKQTGPVTAEGFTAEDQKDIGAQPEQPEQPDEPDEPGGERPVPIYVWVAGGATIAAAGVWGAFVGLSATKKSEYEESLGVAPIEEQEELRDQLVLNNTLADVFLGVSVAGAATTLVLFLTRPTVAAGGEDKESAGRARSGLDWAVVPTAHPRGGGGAILTGSF